jgi:hypothetical protein
MAPERVERVFMVRMWLPVGDPSVSEWRGSVRDVQTERTFYVVGTREIADYIASALPPIGPVTE